MSESDPKVPAPSSRPRPPVRHRTRRPVAAPEPPEAEPEAGAAAAPEPDDVGYKKPPKSKQFKKGEVNNPAGRPKKSRNFWTVYDEERDKVLTARGPGGRAIKVTQLQASLKQLWAKAATGDMKAIENVIRYEQLRQRPGEEAPRETPLTAEEKARLAYFVEQLAKDHEAGADDAGGGKAQDGADEEGGDER